MRSVLVLLLVGAVAFAGPVKEAAAKVLAEFRAQRDLKELAAIDKPDPWKVADQLCRQGEHDAAVAFAKAAPRPDTEKLPAYVESRRGKTWDEVEWRTARDAQRAIEAGDMKAALAALERAEAAEPTVASARIRYGRGDVLRGLRRLKESAAAYARAAGLAERIGWLSHAASAFHEAGRSAYQRSDWRGAVGLWEERLRIERVRGYAYGVAESLSNIGIAHKELAAYRKALDCLQQALARMEVLKKPSRIAGVLNNIGLVHEQLGETANALEYYERSREIAERIGHRRTLAAVLGNIGNIHHTRGRYAKALEYRERSRKMQEELGDRAGVAGTLGAIANSYDALGDYAKALACQEQALRVFRDCGNRRGVSLALTSLGVTYWRTGDYARALDYCEKGLREAEATGLRPQVATALLNIGIIRNGLGDHANALAYLERARKLMTATGNRAAAATALNNIGAVHHALRDYDKALACYEQSLKLCEKLGELSGVGATLGNMGLIHMRRGSYAEALEYYERSRKLKERLGDRAGVAAVLANIGLLHTWLNDPAKARRYTEQSLALAKQLGATETELVCYTNLATLHLRRRRPAEAARLARAGLEKLPLLTGRLDDVLAAGARDRWTDLALSGTYAGKLLKNPAMTFFFLESGRAGALLESLTGRRAIRAAAAPEKLRRAERTARAREALALTRYRRALDAGQEVEALWSAVEKARGQILETVARIRRAQKSRANLVYPEPAELEDVQQVLREDEALVLCVIWGKWNGALVVERKQARFVEFEESGKILKAARALIRAASRTGERGMRPPPHETVPYLKKRLRRLFLDPLGLGDGVRRILIAPAGELAYLPVSLLTKREVVFVPSATTYKLLHDEERTKRGKQVLALGDPLTQDRLPASAEEAKAVGDVVLLGKDATAARLREALGKGGRWRAVHLACHGVIDPSRPSLSELALTGAPLRCFEVFQLRIPADLVVLSACETGKGKIYKAEGVIGWTRAFMFAGAPRVMVSLWKVDDAATGALMERFYALWKNGKMPAATALKQAQEFVRSQERWKHPYFWAAWQLWGLAE